MPVNKHVSDTTAIKKIRNSKLYKNLENFDINYKIKKAKNNWERLIDKLIQKRIEILRELIKKEKEILESEEEDENIEDFLKSENNKDTIEQNEKKDMKEKKPLNKINDLENIIIKEKEDYNKNNEYKKRRRRE